MRWQKKGLVYAPSGDLWWARSHAHLPTVDPVGGALRGAIRVYFTGLDENSYGRIGWVDLDAADPTQVLAVSREPVLDLGDLGAFDDCGVVVSCILPFKGSKYMYYHGFQRTARAPYILFTGLAVASTDGTRFEKVSRVPVLDRIDGDPFMRAAPWVLDDGGLLKMWYVSCVDWSERNGGLHYHCTIRNATSRDGIAWESCDAVCIEPAGDEYAVGRPCVLHEDGVYKMWYSRRGFSELYAMGYAESADGVAWERKDELAGLRKSAAGWDSEMVCYPCVADVAGRRLLFYNGNRRGASGFGVAEWAPVERREPTGE